VVAKPPPSYLKSCGCQMKSLVTGKGQTFLPFLRKKGRPGELQAGEPHLCAWEDHGADPPTRGRNLQEKKTTGEPNLSIN